jgi:hypothetical protein
MTCSGDCWPCRGECGVPPPYTHAARKLAVRLCEAACGGRHGMPVGAPIYRDVVEWSRKYPGPKYSSCGDLPHWMLYRLGVRLPWINRYEHTGFRVGWNITYLADTRANPRVRPVRPGEKFESGDTIVVWSRVDTKDAHAIVVVDHLPAEGILLTAEYGQPGGALRARRVTTGSASVSVEGRMVRAWLPLDEVLLAAHSAGQLQEASIPEWCNV